mmetsp:Transcript_15513/g.42077  ORF Transcript_15513/g.42077 Transcript_15513/m.42077 type:complete len:112 (-) Transcript_15513:14-349(-)
MYDIVLADKGRTETARLDSDWAAFSTAGQGVPIDGHWRVGHLAVVAGLESARWTAASLDFLRHAGSLERLDSLSCLLWIDCERGGRCFRTSAWSGEGLAQRGLLVRVREEV